LLPAISGPTVCVTCRLILANNDQQEIRILARYARRIYAEGGQVHALLAGVLALQNHFTQKD